MHFSWQQKKPPNTNLGSTPQLSSPMGSPPSPRPPTCMLLLLIRLSFDAMRVPCCCLRARHICLLLGSALTPSQNPHNKNAMPPLHQFLDLLLNLRLHCLTSINIALPEITNSSLWVTKWINYSRFLHLPGLFFAMLNASKTPHILALNISLFKPRQTFCSCHFWLIPFFQITVAPVSSLSSLDPSYQSFRWAFLVFAIRITLFLSLIMSFPGKKELGIVQISLVLLARSIVNLTETCQASYWL